MTNLQISEILSRTNGSLCYIEQFYEIGTKVLKLEKNQIEKMYQAYNKKTKEVKQFNQFILDELNNSELANSLIFLFKMQGPLLDSELVINLQKSNYKMVISNILNTTEGKLQYYYQAHMILTDVIGLTDYQAQAVISNYKNPKLIEGEKEYILKKIPKQPDIAEQVHQLLLNANSFEYTVSLNM